MKRVFKRMGALLLTTAMLATMIPSAATAVSAATMLETSVTGLTATWEYSNQGGGSATWTGSGTSISAICKGTAAKTNISVLTLVNALGSEAVLSFNYALTTGGTTAATRASLSGAITVSNQASASGVFSQTLAAGESVAISLKSPRHGTAQGSFSITDLALVSTTASDPVLTFKPAAEGGSYTVDGETVTIETTKEVALQTALTLSAATDEGYIFYGWYDEKSGKYLSQDEQFTLIASVDATIRPIYVQDSVPLFGVGSAKYDNLTDAVNAAAASATNKTVVLLNDSTLTGTHTIPAGVTLLIPYDDAYTVHGALPATTSSDGNAVAWVEPTAYRTLTMAADATMIVEGALEVGGRHSAAGGSGGPAAPTDSLGFIQMTAGSHIEVRGSLYCWGYIYGDGTVTAKAGAGVYEVFQVMDFRGGTATLALAADRQVFPITQYYVQNVEVATTYEYGSTAYVSTTVFVQAQCVTAPPIEFIGGAEAMFQTGEGCVITKRYDPSTDTLHLEANGDCSLNKMFVSLAGNSVDTSHFALPISNNIHITLRGGQATMNQDIIMLPGASLTIENDAVLIIPSTDTPSQAMQMFGGYSLILYDKDNWTSGISATYQPPISNDEMTVDEQMMISSTQMESGLNFVHNGNPFRPILYSPSENRKERTAADLTDATLDVNGVLFAEGYIYSTVLWNNVEEGDFTVIGGGANVSSSKKSGIILMGCAGQNAFSFMFDQAKDTAFKSQPDYVKELAQTRYYAIPLSSVQLKNGDGTMLDTTGADAGAMFTYCAQHDHWIAGEECTAVTITWVVGDEVVTSVVMPGTVPTYPNSTPVKTWDATYHYVFAGWSATADGAAADLPAVTGAATYYAVFTAVAHTYGAAATNDTHACVCGKTTACVDVANDGDHLCDLGCGATKSEHVGGTASCDKQAVCTECGTDYGAFLPHTPGKEADCGHTQTCTVCGVELAPATGRHPYDSVVTAPDCENGGYTTYTCPVCGDEYVGDYVDANGHKYEGVVTDPDCENEGYTTYTCTVCGHSYKGDYQQALNHSYESVVTDPDCYNGGYTTHTCTRCGDRYVDAYTDPAGHAYPYECSTECFYCGAPNPSPTEHISDAWAPCFDGNCVQCGAFVPASDDKHMPDGWACKELWCAWCGKNLPLTAEHDYQIDEVIEPDCDEGGYTVYACSVCGDTYTDDETDPSGHSYDDDMDAECNDCGYVRKVEYTIVSFVSNSVSKDVRGLAFRFAAQVTGLTMNMEHVADYSAAIATPHSWAVGVRVVRMGAVVSNDTAGTYLANVDKKHTLDIPAVLLMELTETGAEYAVRVRYIPENKEDAPVLARPYMVCEDADGNQMEVYGDEVSATYSDVLSKH